MDAAKYRDILDNNLEQSAVTLGIQDNYIFQHDNDPKHASKLVKEFLRFKCIDVPDHPPQSPDLNPIENLWDKLDRMIKMEGSTSLSSRFRMIMKTR